MLRTFPDLESTDSRLERNCNYTQHKLGDLVRIIIKTCRTLPDCFSVFNGRRERGHRSLLIVSSDRELKVNRRSSRCSTSRISSTADSCPVNGYSFVHIVHIQLSKGILYYPNPYPSIHSPKIVRLTVPMLESCKNNIVTFLGNQGFSCKTKCQLYKPSGTRTTNITNLNSKT
jgi:hypothetical protein